MFVRIAEYSARSTPGHLCFEVALDERTVLKIQWCSGLMARDRTDFSLAAPAINRLQIAILNQL